MALGYVGKRCFDIVVSTTIIFLLSPFLFVIAVGILTSIGKPILFIQKRPGLHGKPFNLVKFRTMTSMCDAGGVLLADEQRLNHFGLFLRSTSLDELPEIFNIIRGDMSFVGPRPLLMRYLPRYTAAQVRRHEAKPGLTGWAQVNGRNALSWEEKFKLDIYYVENQHLWLDIKILLMTVNKVLRRDGISHAGEVTMNEFLGSQNPQKGEEPRC